MLAAEELEPGDVDQSTLDFCHCDDPVVPDCVFTPIPYFDGWNWGCNVYDPDDYGDLGNFGEMCPADAYTAQELCQLARAGIAEEGPLDPEYWIPGLDEDTDEDLWVPYDYPEPQDDGIDPITGFYGYIGSIFFLTGDLAPNDYETFQQQGAKMNSDTDLMRWNQFGPEGGGNTRNVVVLGSSMMSTHFQFQNGKMCSRASTAADRVPAGQGRGMRGNDFTSSPAWNTRVPWNKALALGRTGFTSKDVNIGGAGIPDACGNPWTTVTSPSDLGVEWLKKEVAVAGNVDTANALMITDGGLINDLQTVDGAGWSKTLGGLVLCSAMEKARPKVDQALAYQHSMANQFNLDLKGKDKTLIPPTVWVERWTPTNRWKDALDLPQGAPQAKCFYRIKEGNGIKPAITEAIAKYPHITVPPLKRLWAGLPADHAVWGTIAQIVQKYTVVKVKQIWLQYPHMESAQVTVGGHDLAIVLPEGVSNFLVEHFGIPQVTIDAIYDDVMKNRIHQVSEDLNELMYNALGCNAVAPYAENHPAIVCKRDPATNAPLVVVTSNAYPGWGPNDHQRTIMGGMPHESSSGADKMGLAIRAADALP